MTTTTAIDLCAGPGGWDLAARILGIETIGIEFDAATCQTRRARGLRTIEGDIRQYGPGDFPESEGLIASPPCQTFSRAGNGSGRRALEHVLDAVQRIEADRTHQPGSLDERTALVLEPLRWALQARDADRPYRWIALEQVPDVLPVWAAIDEVLERNGYTVFHGKLHAEQFGVPQTRTRAFLIARLDAQVQWPKPDHSRFHVRYPERLDEGVKPWITMGEALGWRSEEVEYASSTMANASRRHLDQPAPTMAFGNDSASAVFLPRGADARLAKAEGTARRITVEEAAAIQTFPAFYPWRGPQSGRFRQIGNAVPPMLAHAVLTEAIR